MEAVGVASVGGGGRGFGSGGMVHDSGGSGRPDTANTMFRLSGQDFKQLGAQLLPFHKNASPIFRARCGLAGLYG